MLELLHSFGYIISYYMFSTLELNEMAKLSYVWTSTHSGFPLNSRQTSIATAQEQMEES